VVATALFLAACTSPQARPSARVAVVAPQRWEHFDDARSWPLAAEPFATSAHGATPYVVSVRVAPAFVVAYRELVAGEVWVPGASVAAFHATRSGEPASLYAMTKQSDGSWEYVVAAADGTETARGPLPLCIRCHTEAPADSLFGVPRAARESAPSGMRSSRN
jgi:hypothetical protein